MAIRNFPPLIARTTLSDVNTLALLAVGESLIWFWAKDRLCATLPESEVYLFGFISVLLYIIWILFAAAIAVNEDNSRDRSPLFSATFFWLLVAFVKISEFAFTIFSHSPAITFPDALFGALQAFLGNSDKSFEHSTHLRTLAMVLMVIGYLHSVVFFSILVLKVTTSNYYRQRSDR